MKNPFFDELKAGLEDAIAHKKGKLKLRYDIIETSESLKRCEQKKNQYAFFDPFALCQQTYT